MRQALLSARLRARSLAVSCSHTRGLTSAATRYLRVSEEVQQAVAESRPVVALETTIYTHGFPYPENMALATSLEAIVRALGAVPATIGILDGVARVGLDREELLRLTAASQDPVNLLKISRRDLGFALGARTAGGRRWNGGTTIAGTSLLANLAGIKVFATGGLGGVHRGAESTFDISADLTELGRTPVAVIAAGCKAFLDIAKTLEYLETQGVPVMTLADGRSGQVDFPGFWSRDSGCPSPMTVQTPEEAAAIVHAQISLGLQSGTFIGCPVPAQFEIPFPKIKSAIEQAVAEADKAGITGHRNTPFILNKIKELTGSQSIKANTALIESNVTAGTRLAIELARLENEDSSPRAQPVLPAMESTQSVPSDEPAVALPQSSTKADVYVAGMLAVDFACDYRPRDHAKHRSIEMATSNPARITQSLGGVGHNVALAAHLSGASVKLCSAVGDDMNGKAALAALQAEGVSAEGVLTLSGDSRTAQYVAVNDEKKDLVVAMADMSILEGEAADAALRSTWKSQLLAERPSHVVVDANWSPKHLASWISIVKQAGSATLFEPVSTTKSTGLFVKTPEHSLKVFPQASVDLSTPNSSELSSMYDTAREQGHFDRSDWWQVVDAFGISSQGARAQLAMATTSELVDQGIPQKTLQLLPYIPCIATKLGAQGVLVTQIIPSGDARLSSSEYAPYILSRCNNGTEETVGVGGIYIRLFPVPVEVAADEIVSVNGVGDTFAGVLVAGLARRKKEGKAQRVEELIDVAQRASVLTLKSREAVSPGLGTLSMLI